jgi:hypothetical protein|tara:strand:+ start:184 stop:618 length:435 start_codon:yes stop_codon:yes gene_type:complete
MKNWDIDYPNGKIIYNGKWMIKDFRVVAQRSGLNNEEIMQYNFQAILAKTVGPEAKTANMDGALAVNGDMSKPDDVICAWYQLAGPQKTRRTMKESPRKLQITYALQQMAIEVHKQRGPQGVPVNNNIGVARTESQKLPDFLQR